jgi:hypothetical protein
MSHQTCVVYHSTTEPTCLVSIGALTGKTLLAPWCLPSRIGICRTKIVSQCAPSQSRQAARLILPHAQYQLRTHLVGLYWSLEGRLLKGLVKGVVSRISPDMDDHRLEHDSSHLSVCTLI